MALPCKFFGIGLNTHPIPCSSHKNNTRVLENQRSVLILEETYQQRIRKTNQQGMRKYLTQFSIAYLKKLIEVKYLNKCNKLGMKFVEKFSHYFDILNKCFITKKKMFLKLYFKIYKMGLLSLTCKHTSFYQKLNQCKYNKTRCTCRMLVGDDLSC